MKHFERELPQGYVEAYSIDAKKKSTVILMNVLAILAFAVLYLLMMLPLFSSDFERRQMISSEKMPTWLVSLVMLVIYIGYIVLHELTHGVAYKSLTGEKLTYGFTLSVAFCGVPHIYVSRRVALIASAAPLVVFTVLFGALAATLFLLDTMLYTLAAVILCAHLSGCVGDIWVISLLLFKLRDPAVLVKDTGPKQIFMIPQKGE